MKRIFALILVGSLTLLVRFTFVAAEEPGLSLDLGYNEFSACIVAEVDLRQDSVKYTVEFEAVKILVNALPYPVFEYGDCLNLRGNLDIPGVIEDFDYQSYLARFGIHYVFYAKDLSLEKKAEFSFFRELFRLKDLFRKRINELFSEPYSSFMLGLLLGSKKGMSEEVLADFKATGLTHIVAVSGYNVSLVVIAVFAVLGSFNLGRRLKVVVSIFSVVLFVLFVGASAAVVRAGLMGIVSLLTIYYGRLYVTGTAILFAAYLMGMFNPLILIYDTGFHLSFLATLGIVYLYPFLEKKFGFIPSVLALKESLLMTIAAQIAVSPVLILNFGFISWISPLVNVLVLPLIPAAMLLGFLAVVSSFFSLLLADIFAFLAYLDLRLILWIVEIFA